MSPDPPDPFDTAPRAAGAPGASLYVRRHLRFGWWSLLAFLSLGLVLESMHGLKVGWYLDVSNETRRLTWTLGHAHGVLLSLVQMAFAGSVHLLGGGERRWHRLVSPALIAANVLLPGGFLLGGLFVHGGDPGLGILLVPLGGVLLFVAVLLTARAVGSALGRAATSAEDGRPE